MRARPAWIRGLVGVMLAGPIACNSSSDGGQVCTAIFAFITAVAVDPSGQPVSGLVVTDSVIRTGAVFQVPQEPILGAGRTVIFSDGFDSYIKASGDPVQVIGTGAGKRFSAAYQFGTDGCHVRKISGPDTVLVQ